MGHLCATRQAGIFACTGGGYSSDGYLAYCEADAYGDYDHGAIWFEFEPDVIRRAADVLLLGNSRLQFALSTAAILTPAAVRSFCRVDQPSAKRSQNHAFSRRANGTRWYGQTT